MYKNITWYVRRFIEELQSVGVKSALYKSYNYITNRLSPHTAIKYIYEKKIRYKTRKIKSTDKNNYVCRVLAINHEMSITGAPLSLKNVIKILEKNNCDVDILSFQRGNHPDIFDDTNCNVYYIPHFFSKSRKIKQIISSYDFVICNTILSVEYAKFCFENNIPHMFVIREAKSLDGYSLQCDILRSFIDKDKNNIYCVSEYAQKIIHNLFNVNINILHNFIMEEKKLEVKHHEEAIIFSIVGSLVPRKALDICVKAFLKLNVVYKNKWKLYIIGKMSTKNKKYWGPIKEISSSYNNIVWMDELHGTPKWKYFNQTDVFIIPSLDESCSRVVLEAAMLEKPCIISENIGAKYIVQDGAGFIVKTADSNSLSQCIQNILLMDREQIVAIGKKARINYENTSTESIYEKNIMNIILENIKSNEKCNFRIKNRHLPPKKIFVPKDTDKKMAVIVPIYNNVRLLHRLIPSLFNNTQSPHIFIFIDDCSDSETKEYLQKVCSNRNDCIVIHNEKNLGFVKSVNKGAQYAEGLDFVILNSDTEVPQYWLRRIAFHLQKDNSIASVTPYSSCATIYSFPFIDNYNKNLDILEKEGTEKIDSIFRSFPPTETIEIPTAHGFCMAISRKAWNDVGPFNDVLFGRGYGEEVDWSQRAREKGWKHVLASNLYVAHYHKGSFSSAEKMRNILKSSKIINSLYADYQRDIQKYIQKNKYQHTISALLTLAEHNGQSKISGRCTTRTIYEGINIYVHYDSNEIL